MEKATKITNVRANASRLSNVDIAVFALCSLGGAEKKIHIEEVTLECFRIARKRFCWELSKYEDYPDKTITHYALGDARKEKYGELVKSTGTRGAGGEKFQMTLNGVRWIKENKDRIADNLKIKKDLLPLHKMQDIVRTIKSESAFKKFHSQGVEELSIYDLADFLGSSFETSPSAIRKKFSEMKVKAELVEDNDISEFLLACENHFKLLHGESEGKHG